MGARGGAVEVGVLGRIRALVAGQEIDLGGPRQQALLAALAARSGRTVTADELADAIWDGEPPAGSRRTLRSYVSRLRRAFDRAGVDGTALVHTDSSGYRLDDAVAVDADLFEAEAARAGERLVQGEPVEAARLAEQALRRWRGPAFGPFGDRVWSAPAAARLDELRIGAAQLRARSLLEAADVPQAVALLEELAAAEPLRESVTRLHALALYRSGRDAEGLGVLRQFRARLADEHGLDPSDEVDKLESMILERDPRLDRSVSGRRLRGYVLHEPIANSPLGTVHRAEQPSIGREVAITVLRPALADDPDVVRAFRTRLQAVAGLDHPHVLPVYDYWREPGGAYVVTRLPRRTLAQAMEAGDVTPRDATRIGEQLALALAAAHEQGVVHGAITPETVVLDDRGEASLWGFAPSTHGGLPARDVAALAALVHRVASAGPTNHPDGAVELEAIPTAVRSVLARATDPADGPVVTAAGLARSLAAARAGVDDPAPLPIEVGPNPYRGLAAFRETDADVFFGRDGLVEQLLARVRRHRTVTVVGPSGSGKSSVVRAGLLPRYRTAGTFVTTMVPGARPLAELEVALSRVATLPLVDAADDVVARPDGLTRLVRRVLPTPGADLVLVVDQFEELFTLSDPTERDLFLDALVGAVADHRGPVRLVLTLRADFLGTVLTHPTASVLVRDRSVLVGPLEDHDVHDVVVRPAERAGVAVEPALATALVADAARAPGSLPMVQFALTEVFAAVQDEGVMTLEAYRRIGGIEGVLGQRAEEVHETLDADGRRAVRLLFQRLVVPHDDGPPTRRRVRRTDLQHVPDEVLEAYGRARLLRFDQEEHSREPTVEVSHEALFGAWPRLAAWIDEGEQDLRLLGHLMAAAADWDAGGREDSELYRGPRLDAVDDFADAHAGELSPREVDFVTAARRRRDRERATTRRTVRRLRALTGGLATGLLVALVAGSLAWSASRRESEARLQQEETARSAQVDALAFAASSEVAEDTERASLLASQAYGFEPDLESQGALLDVLAVEPRILSLRPTPFDTCSEATGSGEVVLFATVSLDGEHLELRTLDQEIVRRFPLEPSPTYSCAALTPSGGHVVVRHEDKYVVHDLNMRVVAVRDDVLAPSDQRSMDLHPTRSQAALVRDDGVVVVATLPELVTLRELELDLGRATGGAGQALQGPGAAEESLVRAVVWSEDASLLAVADADTVHVVDDDGRLVASTPAASGQGARPFVSAGAGVFGHLSPDALVVAPLDAPARAERIVLGATSTPYRRGVAVEPGGRRAAVATEHGVQVVDLVDRTTAGGPIPVDAHIIDLFWSAEGRLNGVGPNGVVQLDVDRTLLLGELVAEVPEADGNTPVSVASDAGGVVSTAPTGASTYRDLTTQTEVDLGRTLAAPLAGGRWFALDVGRGSASVGTADGVVQATSFVGELGDDWQGRRLTVGEGSAAVLLRGTTDDPDLSVALLFDTATAELVQRVEPGAGQVLTAAVPVDSDRLLLADLRYRWTIVDADGRVVDGPRVLGVGQEVAAAEPGTDRYATADWNGDLHVVDPGRDVVVDLAGPASFAVAVAFVDDDRLLSRHIDGSTYLWDVPSGRRVGRLWQSAPFAFFDVAVDPAADEVVHVMPGAIARIPLDPDRWFAAVCSRVDRQLSAVELAAVAPGLSAGPGCP